MTQSPPDSLPFSQPQQTANWRASRSVIAIAAIGMSLFLTACAGGGGAGATASAPPAPSNPLPTVDTAAVAVADPGSRLAPDWMSGTFMEIYVRGYQDSDGDGVGDLKGVIQRLDYLKDLGIGGIWLMPVTKSQDNDHGYAVSDYRNIENQYGSLADLDDLLREAHARGIGVILDYVINHSAEIHPAFANSRSSVTNAYRDWYLWQSTKPTGWSIYNNDPWRPNTTNNSGGFYFTAFSETMPDFNLSNPAVLAWHHNNLRFWLNRGVDGFRFDAVGNLVENGPAAWEAQPQNYAIMADVRRLLNGYLQRYMVCEAPADPIGFARDNACGSAFAFKHNTNIIKSAKGDLASVRAVADYHLMAPPNIATMVSNHDAFAGQRLWDEVSGNLAQYRLAAATYLLQPGIPFVYYGEEIGMAGAATLTGDQKLRTPMSWSADTVRAGFTSGTPFRALSANVASNNAATQVNDGSSLHAFYKSMIGLRKSRASLARGRYDSVVVNGAGLGFRRALNAEETLVAINYGATPVTVTMTGLTIGNLYVELWPSAGATRFTADSSGSVSIGVPPQGIVVLGK